MAQSGQSPEQSPHVVELARLLAAVPHRPLFLAGTIVVLLSMTWWSLELASLRFGFAWWPQPTVSFTWGHAMLIQYGLFPLFMFGFLLTTFPRWLGRPSIPKTRYLPVAGGVFLGYVLSNVGLLGMPKLLATGVVLMLGGYLVGIVTLAGVLKGAEDKLHHAKSCLTALSLGALGLGLFLVELSGLPEAHGHGGECAWLAIRIGTFGLLLPIYFTVTHRMLPFFTGNVAPGYVVIRPQWSLPVVWLLLLLHLVLEWRGVQGWLWLPDVPLALVFAYHSLAWQPWKAMHPGLCAVLHIAFAWLPIAFILYSVQDLTYLATERHILGRAPLHALAIGYFGSMLVAMVTRVTQGHSGRPLQMSPIPWLCFVLLQIVAVIRVGGEFAADGSVLNPWFLVAAVGWIVAFLPWVVRSAWIYLTPRIDGRPG